MKLEVRLDYVVFQLTPTRTRCDLVVIANGKTEKIASGLLDPFLTHLKTAQDENAKGGYSIKLEPDPGCDATWFTKGTVERFVRFVNTPEVLERVHTIESEIFQIEEAISIQSNEYIGLDIVEDRQMRSVESIGGMKRKEINDGSKPLPDTDSEKAIVLYKPGIHPVESNGSTRQEENSKVQLLRVLETRKTVLQKEQGMAFARAVAAGFDMDHMAPLISFAESFRASRLMDACLRFKDLWKRKHETGQWLEIEAAEAMSTRSDLSLINASGIMLSSETKKQLEFREGWPESHSDLKTESNGKISNAGTIDQSSDHLRDGRPVMEPQVSQGHHEYFHGQFQLPMFPQWPIYPPPGTPPVFQAYPMQGMPYYQNYPGSPFFKSPYPPTEDPRVNSAQRMNQKKDSTDDKDGNSESDASEVSVHNSRSQDGLDFEKEGSHLAGSGKKQSGTVVIKNINYIASKRDDTSGNASQSTSDSETDEESESRLESSYKSSKSKGIHINDKDSMVYGQEADVGNWKAFQDCLLRVDGNGNSGMEEKIQVKRRQNTSGGDPLVRSRLDVGDVQEDRMTRFHTINGKGARKSKANGEVLISRRELNSGDDFMINGQFSELDGARAKYRGARNDDFMINGQKRQSGSANSRLNLESGMEGGVQYSKRTSLHNITDESFVVPVRMNPQIQVETDRGMAIHMGSELPSTLQKTKDLSNRIRSQIRFDPDDLSLMPKRGTERDSIGINPVVDYEMQLHRKNGVTGENKKKDVLSAVKKGFKKLEMDKKSKAMQDALQKRRMDDAMKKGKQSKLSPLTEAKTRAERLRAFKADIQKLKKEKEEEEMKRLEALKRERQQRIAERGSSSATSQKTQPRLSTKLSPTSLQRLSSRTASVGSNDSRKTKPSKLNNGDHFTEKVLSRTASSLPELKKEKDSITPKSKVAITRIRRLSEPKTSNGHHDSSVKVLNKLRTN